MKNINYKRIGYHVLFWVVINVTYDAVLVFINKGNFGETLIHDFLFYTPSDMIGVYFTIYFLIPKFLLKKQYFKFIFAFLAFFVVLIVVLSAPLQYFGDVYVMKSKHHQTFWYFLSGRVLYIITLKLMIIGIATTIKLSKIWMKSQERRNILEKEKLEIALKLKESELKYLKSQINPHFLFNALNNLYSLTLVKSEKAPEVVLKISAFLDYVLYDCNVPFIELDKEIKNLENYIDLQKIRFNENAVVNFDIQGSPSNIKIAPLILLPFIENAFKHGLTKNMGKGKIDIKLKITGKNIFFVCKNTVSSVSDKEEKGNHGIGLVNVQKRLKLQYKENFDIKITQTEEYYSIELNLSVV